jgi:hypothetical protein
MTELLEIRGTQLPAEDVDFLRPHARGSGYTNTGVGVLRFAVRELAQRLRHESSGIMTESASNRRSAACAAVIDQSLGAGSLSAATYEQE